MPNPEPAMMMPENTAIEATTETQLCAGNDARLLPRDFQLLARPFAEAVACLFPEGLALDFVTGLEKMNEGGIEQEEKSFLLPLRLADEAVGVKEAEESQVYLRLSTQDSALAKRISADWLEEQAGQVLHILSILRPAFIDCASGLYNLRALAPALHLRNHTFFLLHLGCVKKNISETMRSYGEAATLLRQHLDAALFACGFGLFAALRPEKSSKSAGSSARLLQRRLRQEGLSRVQILHLGAEQALSIFSESGLAGFQEYLANVDRQGPFGIFSVSGLNERRTERFRLAENQTFRHLQQKWRGQKIFSLVFFRLEDEPDEPNGSFNAGLLAAPELAQYGEIWPADERTLVSFLAGLSPQEAAGKARLMREHLLKALPGATIATGIAGWPCLDYAKKYIPANGLKALLHASLLGAGEEVIFDQLSLNVSGDFFFEEDDYHQAIREYRRGLLLKPDDVNLLNSLGVTLAAYGQEQRAAACFRQALGLEAENHMALANLGYILLRQGKNHEALHCLEQAYSAFPAAETLPRELLRPLVALKLEEGQYEAALLVLRRWAESGAVEKDALYQRYLGLALEGCGKIEEAMRAFEQALKLSPQDATSLGHLGGLYQVSGEGQDLGLHLCRQAIRLEQNDASLWNLLAWCHFNEGNMEAAAEAIRHSLRLNRLDARAMNLTAQIALQKKNDKEARYWLNRALKLHTISEEQKEQIRRSLAELAKLERPAAGKAAQTGRLSPTPTTGR